jgi:formate hydrogenlyase subunit 3/multisubunit Na+/H+ antiporter MnhD subunit
VLGEICLLLGFALLHAAAPGDSLAIRDVVAALPAAPARAWIVTLLILGFGLKAGLVPLHVWLPLAHPAAPMPASAVLSGAIVKAGIIGLIRFLPFGESLPGWGEVLAAMGLFTAFYGVAIGITQANPKTVLAYSSVSQMGVTVAVLGLALAAGEAGWTRLAAFYAVHHACWRRAPCSWLSVSSPLWRCAIALGAGAGGTAGTGLRWPAADRRRRGEAGGEGCLRRAVA